MHGACCARGLAGWRRKRPGDVVCIHQSTSKGQGGAREGSGCGAARRCKRGNVSHGGQGHTAGAAARQREQQQAWREAARCGVCGRQALAADHSGGSGQADGGVCCVSPRPPLRLLGRPGLRAVGGARLRGSLPRGHPVLAGPDADGGGVEVEGHGEVRADRGQQGGQRGAGGEGDARHRGAPAEQPWRAVGRGHVAGVVQRVGGAAGRVHG
mmetsp:Transcript_8958/g.28284  ORF Transcript_8958/g.28284 Transcript_8958/m.28284 type:complete len:212 (+) Transcript_8958:176-811(+)